VKQCIAEKRWKWLDIAGIIVDINNEYVISEMLLIANEVSNH